MWKVIIIVNKDTTNRKWFVLEVENIISMIKVSTGFSVDERIREFLGTKSNSTSQ